MLRASGETIAGPRPSDLFDIFVDDDGDLVVVLIDVEGATESSGSVLGSLMRQTRLTLQAHAPLHQVASELELQLALRPGVEAGLVILRLSQRHARVELLNAGMPPVASALTGGQSSLHPPLSSPVGRRVGEVHPYELLPLLWGSAWLVLSDGMTSGLEDLQTVRDLCAQLDLEGKGMSLAASSGETLYDVLQDILPPARFLDDDASCVFVAADALDHGDRFQSGIQVPKASA